MRAPHKQLKRQIEKEWGDRKAVPSHFAAFIDAVNETYWQNEIDNQGLSRCADLYRAVFENAAIAAVIVEEDGTIALANSSFEKLSGYTRGELEKKKKLTEFLVEEEASKAAGHEPVQEGLALDPRHYETQFSDRSGAARSCMNDVCAIPGSAQVLVSVLDLTNLKRLQNQLMHAQKMEAIGTLASGIAHDFNNLLMGIQGHISLMLLDAENNPGLRDRLEGVQEHVKRGADLARQLLGLGQTGKYRVRPIALNDVIEKTAAMFGRTRKEIAIHKSFQGDLWTVEADQGEMERVLLNLFVNAGQAMPGGGVSTWRRGMSRWTRDTCSPSDSRPAGT